jgi:nitric oxide reductase large subunit
LFDATNTDPLIVAACVVGAAVYFLPSVVGRKKRNRAAIFVLNLLAGWTFFGWVAALVWAMTKEDPPRY